MNSESLVVNPIALRKAKLVCNFGLSECNRVIVMLLLLLKMTPQLSFKIRVNLCAEFAGTPVDTKVYKL